MFLALMRQQIAHDRTQNLKFLAETCESPQFTPSILPTTHANLVDMNPSKPLVLFLTFGSALLFTSSCSGDGRDIKVEDLASEAANTVCNTQVECGIYPDKATCLESINGGLNQLVAEVEAGIITYNSAKAGECVDSLGGFDCNIFSSGQAEDREACEATFVGTIALGGACFTSQSCEGHAICDQGSVRTCSVGVCIADVREADANEGESCANVRCEFGLICDDSNVCQEPAGPAEACAGFEECISGYICELGPDRSPGTCVKLPTTGGTCDPAFGGETLEGRLSCFRSTDFCDLSDMTCKGKLPVGTACTMGLENACVNYAECIEATCTAKPSLGENCVVDSQLDCVGELACENGTCIGEPEIVVCPV